MSKTLTSEELAQRWDFVADFAGRLAHDLSNVFTGVNGFSELALMQLPCDHAARPYVVDVVGAGQRGIYLSQRLSLLLTAGIPHSSPTAMSPVVAEAVDRFRPICSPRLSWEMVVPQILPPVRIERDPLLLVLTQLLTNAIEASGETGRISVVASSVDLGAQDAAGLLGRTAAGRHVELRISDSGSGVPKIILDELLEVPMATSKAGHRGLGLAIVFRTLYAHGGGFALEPAAGKGTVVRVYLPAG